MNRASPPLLEANSLGKRFPGVVALDDVDLQLYDAEVLAVIGENGAGKSTLMKILAGIQLPDQGQIRLSGKETVIRSVEQATANGICLIHQELNLCENLSVAANIFLGREPRRFGLIDERRCLEKAGEVLQQVGLNLPPQELVGSLTIGQQQMVEIAKAISTDARMVIMDEPTSSLSQKESESLFEIIHRLKQQGVSIIYISHRLGEVERLADRVTVLRDGKNAGELARDEISHNAMVERMVGRELSNYYSRTVTESDDTVLKISNLRTSANPHCPLSCEIKRGEIVGIAGLVGAGRTELLTTLFGVTPAIDGQITVTGKACVIDNSETAIRHGIGLVPEDRKLQGIVLEMSIRANTSLPTLKSLSAMGFIDAAAERALAESMKQRLNTKAPHIEQPVKFLSGGNQQKVVIAKWLAMKPNILLMDEPTRGVDVGAKQEIYRLMDELAQTGVAILFVSSDMEEVLGMADRILVMHEGQIGGELHKTNFSEESVMHLATGGAIKTETKIA
ncbi:MAG: sugar ABC transporter ATP-binding protein [Pirellulaceae bacterium]|nr:sugar ABC transporter ATP-binding protein [Pirellulaceae bacterium]